MPGREKNTNGSYCLGKYNLPNCFKEKKKKKNKFPMSEKTKTLK